MLASPQTNPLGTARMWPAPAPVALAVTLCWVPTGAFRPAVLLDNWESLVPTGGVTVTAVLTGVAAAPVVPVMV